jgi:hypothetical protein
LQVAWRRSRFVHVGETMTVFSASQHALQETADASVTMWSVKQAGSHGCRRASMAA